MGFFGDFFEGDNDEILFFIVIFLFLFNGNVFQRDSDETDRNDGENSSMLFFIILFILLFFNINWVNDPN